MSEVKLEKCPETGICSIFKSDGTKVDLIPQEVTDIQAAQGDAEKIREILSVAGSGFAESLDVDELGQISKKI